MAGHSAQAPCLFGDIVGMIPMGAFDESGNYKAKLRGIWKCDLNSQQHCYQHSKPCNPHVKRPVFDISGLPCPDYSRANSKRQKKEGPTNSVYIIHGRWATDNKVPLLLVECTEDPYLHCIVHVFFLCNLGD